MLFNCGRYVWLCGRDVWLCGKDVWLWQNITSCLISYRQRHSIQWCCITLFISVISVFISAISVLVNVLRAQSLNILPSAV